jgi:hypothetical protein
MVPGASLRIPRFRLLVPLAVGAAILAAGAVVGSVSYEYQIAIAILLAIIVGATYLIPRAAAKEPSVTTTALALALGAKLLGTLVRYVMLLAIFEGGDALAYHQAGEANYPLVRSMDFGFVQDPFFGTAFVEDVTAFLYAVIGPSMLGAFLIFSTASFCGMWLFYRAHRLSFPDGDGRLYFLLLFFLPTMAFWPSSLGKDALVVFGLGVAIWGLARLLQRVTIGAFVQMAVATLFTFGVRPAVAVMFLAGAGVAFLLHPGAMRSPLSRPITALFLGPVVVIGLVFATSRALTYEKLDADISSVVEEYVATRERLIGEGGSVIEGPAPTTASGLGQAVITVLFRPFPWELSTPLAGVAGLESLLILAIVLLRIKPGFRALRRRWRGGLVICALIITVALIVPLTAAANFGLLVRQRAQLLPFLFMVLTAVPGPRLWRSLGASPYLRTSAPSQAPATSG